MAGDTFGIDPSVIQAAASSFQELQKNAANAATQAQMIEGAMEMVAKARARMGELKIIDPNEAEEVLKSVKQLEKELVKAGVTVNDLVKARRDEKRLIAGMLVDMEQLNKSGKRRVQQEAEALKEKEKFAKVDGQIVKLSDEDLKKRGKIVSAFKDQARSVTNYAQSMAGVQLSLVGIIALIIDLWDKSRKIGALSRQVVEQWERSPKALKEASSQLAQIRYGFKKSWDVAGQYVNILAQAGFEKEHILRLSKDIMAQEVLGRGTAQEQVQNIRALATNFGLTAEQSQIYLEAVKNVSRTIPMLSMGEAVKDWTELIDKTKAYNTDLLGTLALYNTLMREELADKLGLGDMPRVLRRDLAQTITGFSRDMEDGWKAALGEGRTAAERIISFEEMNLGEQFARAIEFADKKTGGFFGKEKIIASRKLLEQMGFGREVAKELTDAMKSGGLSTEGLRAFAMEFGKEREAMEAARKRAESERQNQIKKAMGVATGMTNSMDRLRIWIESKLLPLFQKLIRSIDNLADTFDVFGRRRAVHEAGKAAEERSKRTVMAGLAGLRAETTDMPKSQYSQTRDFILGLKESWLKGTMDVAATRGSRFAADVPEDIRASAARSQITSTLTAKEFRRLSELIAQKKKEEALNMIRKEIWEQIEREENIKIGVPSVKSRTRG